MLKASVIVCTFNRSALLKCLLEALVHQTAPAEEFEVIVVDDGSRDDTEAVCRAAAEGMGNLRYIPVVQNGGLAAAGNRAIAEANGEYLLFTDDDCIPHPRWVENMCGVLHDSPIVAGAMDSPRTNYFMLCHNIAQFYPFMPGQKAKKLDFIAGANMGFQRRVFHEVGVFNTESVIPDMEFILRAREKGFSITYTSEAMVIHKPARVTLGSLLRYGADHAVHTIVLRSRYRDMLRTPFILLSPVFLLLAAPVIALKTTSAIYLGNRRLLRVVHTAPIVFFIKLAWCWGAARGLRLRRKNSDV